MGPLGKVQGLSPSSFGFRALGEISVFSSRGFRGGRLSMRALQGFLGVNQAFKSLTLTWIPKVGKIMAQNL